VLIGSRGELRRSPLPLAGERGELADASGERRELGELRSQRGESVRSDEVAHELEGLGREEIGDDGARSAEARDRVVPEVPVVPEATRHERGDGQGLGDEQPVPGQRREAAVRARERGIALVAGPLGERHPDVLERDAPRRREAVPTFTMGNMAYETQERQGRCSRR
jgi:hypothetical protein